jgi:hypothetical protein
VLLLASFAKAVVSPWAASLIVSAIVWVASADFACEAAKLNRSQRINDK